MKKLLVGCLVIALFAAVLFAVGGYLLYRAAAPVLEDARSYLQGLADLSELEKDIANQSPYTAPASGELTELQVQRFVRVQDSVRSALGQRMDEIEEKYKHLKANADNREQPSIGEVLGALREFGGLFVQARRFQIEALNRENFSQDEYHWVRNRVFEAAGIEVASMVDLQKIGEAARKNTGIDDLKAPELPKVNVPEANRALVKPYVDQMDRWIPLAFFGL
jgi:hypothetical protein